jgi:hypothetical protein
MRSKARAIHRPPYLEPTGTKAEGETNQGRAA